MRQHHREQRPGGTRLQRTQLRSIHSANDQRGPFTEPFVVVLHKPNRAYDDAVRSSGHQGERELLFHAPGHDYSARAMPGPAATSAPRRFSAL